MMVETQKILDRESACRPPACACRCSSHTPRRCTSSRETHYAERARALCAKAPGVLVVDKREDGGYVTPVDAAGEDATYVSRIRKDPSGENGLSMWIVSDNLRKGAALNAVQIAEALINRKLLKAAA